MKFPEKFRDRDTGPTFKSATGDDFGVFMIPSRKVGKTKHTRRLQVIASAGADEVPWEHVSVTVVANGHKTTPTWDEMCLVKSLFWHEHQCVMQLHPPESDYVNVHEGCLHLWKPRDSEIPVPPVYAV